MAKRSGVFARHVVVYRLDGDDGRDGVPERRDDWAPCVDVLHNMAVDGAF